MTHYEMTVQLNVNLGHSVLKRVSRTIETIANGGLGRGHVLSSHIFSGHELKLCLDGLVELPKIEFWRLHATIGNQLANLMDADTGEIAHISKMHRVTSAVPDQAAMAL